MLVSDKNPGQTELPPVLDACCGSRMMWFDRRDPRAIYVDRREGEWQFRDKSHNGNPYSLVVRPDVVADFSALPFPDETFYHVVFDPPHVANLSGAAVFWAKYADLGDEWRPVLQAGFKECFRVLRPGGTLIFKWCEVSFPVSEVLALTPERPLYGHRSGKKAKTHWVAFLKAARQARDLKEDAC